MNRRNFVGITGATVIAVGTISYLLSDKRNLSRADIKPMSNPNSILNPDEKEILMLASLAPSGHNTQPWFVQYIEPYHWIIGNDRTKWLPAVDPTQVSESAGWILITSKDNSVATLLETGKRMQRLFLKVRERSIALHPMTQILEEPSTQKQLNSAVGINSPIQFILRTGYVNDYPPPVS